MSLPFVAFLLLAYVAGCVGPARFMGTAIQPEHFRFATITAAGPDADDGGWRAVCIRATITQGIATGTGETQTALFVCDLEVGVPIKTASGQWIGLRRAQVAAADAANQAAYIVLTKSYGVTATTCAMVRLTMQSLLQAMISGSRVRKCASPSSVVPVVTFP